MSSDNKATWRNISGGHTVSINKAPYPSYLHGGIKTKQDLVGPSQVQKPF